MLAVALACLALTAQAAAPAVPQGVITAKTFLNIQAASLGEFTSNARFPDQPDFVTYAPYFEMNATGDINILPPLDSAEHYGGQLVGYFYPPATGDYVFYVSSDDGSNLYLSTDDSPANKKLIVKEAGWSDSRQFRGDVFGVSTVEAKCSSRFTDTEWPSRDTVNGGAKITLEANRAYYIEAVFSEGVGGDNLSVAVQDPLGLIDPTKPIPGKYLAPIDRTFGPVPDGLVSYWPGDGHSLDLVSGNDAIMHNVGFADGKVGKAFDFNGVNSYLNIPNSPSTHSDNAISFIAWINTRSLAQDWQTIFWKGNWPDLGDNLGGANREYALWLNQKGYLYFSSTATDQTTSGETVLLTPNGSISEGRWYQLAAVIDSAQGYMRIYVDGIWKVERQFSTNGIRNTAGPFLVGCYPVNGTFLFFNGLMDELMLFNRALSSDEIAAAYASGLAGISHLASTIQKDTTSPQQDTQTYLQTKTVLWNEGFEDLDYVNDHVHWEPLGVGSAIGTPHNGPGKAFAGQNCALIEYDGGSPAVADTRLVFDDAFVVPLPAENPRVRFWHWYDFQDGGEAVVEIKTADGGWQALSTNYTWSSGGIWSYPSLDLSPFAGQRVNLAFHFRGKAPYRKTSWFIDEVSLLTGPEVMGNSEGFELGLGDWAVERGTWAVGAPQATNGPATAFRGQKCAGTSLLGNYADTVDSRLISPPFAVPGLEQTPRLRFWHWYRLGDEDVLWVEIREAGGAWTARYEINAQALPGSGGDVWTPPFIDLRDYAGKTIQVAFRFQANDATPRASDNNAGWYIDEVSLETGPLAWREQEGFELGLGNWSTDHGVWTVGAPANTNGPARAADGQNCAGTGLERSYPGRVDSSLISPPIEVPEASANPQLRFSQWYDFAPGDKGWVEVKSADGSWRPLSGTYGAASGGVWSQPSLDLSAYAGATIQIGFHFLAGNAGYALLPNPQNKAGWFIDNPRVETASANPGMVGVVEGFERGQGDWSVDQGVWEVGAPNPAKGPGQTFHGQNCAGTRMVGNDQYPEVADSRLVSPWFSVPPLEDNPRLRFWQWFGFGQGDSGTVEIREPDGAWAPLAGALTGSGGTVWSRPLLDLSPYAGKKVQIAFHFQAVDAAPNGDDNDYGWYIDEITVEKGSASPPVFLTQPEGFESGLGDWAVDRGSWEAGLYTHAGSGQPGAPYRGQGCAGTVFQGGYADGADSRLVSPFFTVPSAADTPRLRFNHWYRFGWGDRGSVEIREPGGPWAPLSDTYTDSGGMTWSRPRLDLRPFGGKAVQVAFHFTSSKSANAATNSSAHEIEAGWFIDDFLVEQGPETMSNIEGFETDPGGWAVDHGFWRLGSPAGANAPGQAFNGQACAGVSLDKTTADRADSRLISPSFLVPPLENHPRARFWQWYSFHAGDKGTVEIQAEDGPWVSLIDLYDGSNAEWSRLSCDLGDYAGKTVRLAFHLTATNTGAPLALSSAWNLDDVEISSGPLVLLNPEGFETGLGDWTVAGKNWEAFTPSPLTVPTNASKGAKSAGVVSTGHQPTPLDSWLITPSFQIPPSQETSAKLRFSCWYSFGPQGKGTVEIREAGGAWQGLQGPWTNSSQSNWLAGFADLTGYAGKQVQIAFHAQAAANEPAILRVDEFRIQTDYLTVPSKNVSGTNTVVEKDLFSFTAVSKGKNLQFQLGPGAPAGAHIDPSMGIFTWKPTEEQGPGYQEIIVGLNDPNNTLSLVDYEIVKVQVLESNEPPALALVEPIRTKPGSQLSMPVLAHDPDLPPQTLTFSLDTGAPSDASIDSQTGMFAWYVPVEETNGTHAISVRVTDNGTPPLSTNTLLTVIVDDGTAAPKALLAARFTAQGTLQLTASGVTTGQQWDLQTSIDLISWQTVQRLRADGGALAYEAAAMKTERVRFYRLAEGD